MSSNKRRQNRVQGGWNSASKNPLTKCQVSKSASASASGSVSESHVHSSKQMDTRKQPSDTATFDFQHLVRVGLEARSTSRLVGWLSSIPASLGTGHYL